MGAGKSSFNMVNEAPSFPPNTKAATRFAKSSYLSHRILLWFCGGGGQLPLPSIITALDI